MNLITRKYGIPGMLVALLLLIASFPAVYSHLNCRILPEDDAFITYRYAENICRGYGPVYNPGSRVFGSTTPLYMVWLSCLKCFLPSIAAPTLAVRLNFIHFILAGYLLFAVVLNLTRSRIAGTAAAMFFLVHPEMLKISIGGMESFMFLWIVLAGFWKALEGKPVRACALAGISALVRPEGVVCFAALLPLVFQRNLKQLGLSVLAFAASPLAWAIPALLYFGSPVPHSIIAKSAPLYPLPPGHAFTAILGEMELWLTRGRLAAFHTRETAPYAGLVVLVLSFHAAILGLLFSGIEQTGWWNSLENRKRSLCVFLFFVSVTGFYAVTNPLYCSWYSPLIFTPWIILLTTGARGYSLLRQSPSRQKILHPQSVIASGAPLLLGIWMLWNIAVSWSDTYYKSRGSFASLGRRYDNATLRIKAYRRAAEWLNRNAEPDSTVLSAEVGSLGFYYRGPVIDACGLVSPESVNYLPVPPAQRVAPEASAVNAELVRNLKPDYVVSMWAFSANSIDRSEWFSKNYYAARRFPLEIHPPETRLWGSKEVTLYRKMRK